MHFLINIKNISAQKYISIWLRLGIYKGASKIFVDKAKTSSWANGIKG